MGVDTVIRGGLVVDGTGAQAGRADLCITDGRVVETADAGGASEVIDADGLVVMPGIVDHHTHYDPQLTFDPYATSSCFHGVTSVVTGQCGFSIAPCKPVDRDYLTGFFAAVEGMSRSVLDTALHWRWESLPHFLGSLEGRLGVNMAIYAGHTSIRRYVMGDAASQREATPEEVIQMRRLVDEGVGAGSLGFASAQLAADRDQFGDPVASSYATHAEIADLAEAAGGHGRGSIAYLPESAVVGIDERDKELLLRLASVSGRPVLIQGMGWRPGMDEQWQRDAAFLDDAAARGAAIYSSYRVQPYTRPFTWSQGTSLYDGVFHWRDLSALSPAERRAVLADPERRADLRWAFDHPNTDGSQGSNLPPPPSGRVFVDHSSADPAAQGRSLEALAAERGVHPADVMADVAVADDLATGFVWRGEDDEWRRGTAASLQHPHLLIGVSDGGAHADRDDGAEWSTYFLSTWVLDREVLSLEEGVRRITSVPADLCGLPGRGRLTPGAWADVVLLDPDRLRLGGKQLVGDLPGGGRRWQVEVEGVERVLVNGETIVVGGELTDALPGQVLRG